MTSKLTEFKNAVLVRNVVARVLEATEFDSPEALKKYLHDHPDADKSKHSVKKKDDDGEWDRAVSNESARDKAREKTKLTNQKTLETSSGALKALKGLPKGWSDELGLEGLSKKIDKVKPGEDTTAVDLELKSIMKSLKYNADSILKDKDSSPEEKKDAESALKVHKSLTR